MLGSFRKGRGNILIWALMAALIVGLAGFGIGAGGGITSQNVARVGGLPVTAEDYARAMQQELRALTQQTGRQLTMTEARQFGVDRMVLARLINDTALDAEADRLGLSTGDAAVHAKLLETPAFHGPDGAFDRDTYTFVLERAGLSPTEFEELVRQESTRDLIAGGVQSAATIPEAEARVVLDFLGEKRSFEWIRLDAALLPEPIPAPTDAELQAEHEAHAADRYTRPETRRITYASITPEALAASIEIPEAELQAAYDADAGHYQTPERRALDRIGFPTEEEAQAAKSRLDAGEIDFDALAAERGLQPGDIDQGTVGADTLAPEARDVVFGTDTPGVVGPVPSPLGPSLYRINAIMAAKTTPFEEIRDEIARDRALEQARRQIADDTAHVQDLIAGGATVEEIASETVLELGDVALNTETTGGLADVPAFRQAAGNADVGVETDLIELQDGGLATLRVDEVEPPAVIPLDEIRDRVAADWTRERTAEALTDLAVDDIADLEGGLSFAELAQRLDRPIRTAGPLTRGETAEGAPPELIADIFAAADGDAVTRADGDGVIVAQITNIEPFDPGTEENAQVLEQIRSQFSQQAKDDVLALYTAALRDGGDVSINQPLIDSTLAQFP
jgi:peptidyl-prolyl cis-trans isomerase D